MLCHRSFLLISVVIQCLVELQLLHVFLILDLHVLGDMARGHNRLLCLQIGVALRTGLCLKASILTCPLRTIDHALHIDNGAVTLLLSSLGAAMAMVLGAMVVIEVRPCCRGHLDVNVVILGGGRVVLH